MSKEQREAVYDFVFNELYTEADIALITGGGGIEELEKKRLSHVYVGRIVENIGFIELVRMTEYVFGGRVDRASDDLFDITLGELATAVLTQQ